jgi:VWFA-related protein
LTDVVVKDQNGNFVQGLKASDFQLFIEGKRVDIKSLDAFNAVSPDDEMVASYMRNLEAASALGGSAPKPPTAPRFVIMFFDRYNMGLRGVDATKAAAKKILHDTLLPYDLVAVFEYNRNMRMLTEPTSDRAKIEAAIDQLGGLSRNDQYLPSQDEIFLPQNEDGIPRLAELLNKKEVEIKNYFTTIRGVVDSLDTLPGRKSYLLFSEGPNIYNPVAVSNLTRKNDYKAPTMNYSPDPGEGTDAPTVRYRNTDAESRRNDGNNFLSSMTNMSNRLTTELTKEYEDLESYIASTNSTLYTIRRGAVNPEWASSITFDLTSDDYRDRDRFLNNDASSKVSFMARSRVESLIEIANRTNGVFYDAGISDEKLTKTLIQEIGNYYVLAFNFPQSASKKFHRIEVKVPGKNLRVIHRKGIYDRKSYRTMTRAEKAMQLQAAMLAPSSKNELDLKAQFYLMPFAQKNTAVYHYEINPNVLRKDANGEHELEMVLRVEDMEGNPLYMGHKRMVGKSQAGNLWQTGNIPFAPEGCSLVMTIRDNISGKISSTRQILKLIHEDKSMPIFTAPVILTSPKPGNLKDWISEDMPFNTQIHEPLTYLGFKLPGMPNVTNNVKQGEMADVFLMVGNLPKDNTEAVDNMYLKFYLDTEDGKSYRIIEKDSTIQFVKQYGAIIYKASIPIGYGQTAKGNVRAVITGVKKDREFVTRVPFTIIDFSDEEAKQLASSGEITEVKSE